MGSQENLEIQDKLPEKVKERNKLEQKNVVINFSDKRERNVRKGRDDSVKLEEKIRKREM